MKSYIFSEGAPYSFSTLAFEPSLFNLPAHLHLQEEKGWCSFFILDNEDIVHGFFHFNLQHHLASSPKKAPFGSIEVSEQLPGEVCYHFINYFTSSLRQKGIQKILIKTPPEAYHSNNTLINSFLLNHGFEIKSAEISSIIKVENNQIESIYHRSEKRKLKKCYEAGFTFHKHSIEDLEIIYQLIKHWRDTKGYALSMTLEKLKQTFETFPANFSLFSVKHHQNIIAASICIQINERVLYDFYHDHDQQFDYESPIVMLVEGIYNHCQMKNIKLLDLGTSMLDDLPNFNLLHFKFLLGAMPTSKFTFEKVL